MAGERTPISRMKAILHGVVTSPWLLASVALLCLVVITAAFADSLIVGDPAKQNLLLRLKPPGFRDRTGAAFPFGTDQLGRSIFKLIVAGAKPALLVGLGAVSVSVLLGVTAGLIAGYSEGPLSDALMRAADLQLSFPFFLLAITVAGILGPSLPLVLLIIGIGNWVPYARVVRAEVLELKAREFVEASRAMGARDAYILGRHIFPNNLPSVTVLVSFNLASAIITESGLSFVGLGVPGSVPSWGRMLSEGRDYVATAWWLPVFPGLAIFLTVLAINLIGDYLREVIDPRLRA